MADDITVTPGTGKTVATDEIAGRNYQIIKLGIGADGSVALLSVGAGDVDTGTPRFTLADDDPAVAQLSTVASNTGAAAGTLTEIAGYLDEVQPTLESVDTGIGDLVLLAQDTAPVAVKLSQGSYEYVAASQTDQMCGSTGAAGDYLAGLLIVPVTTSPGEVSIEDGSTNMIVFTGGASSVTNLVPFFVPLGIFSLTGGWEITTGSNVKALAVGQFT